MPITTTGANERLVSFIVGHSGFITSIAGFTSLNNAFNDLFLEAVAPSAGSYPIQFMFGWDVVPIDQWTALTVAVR